MNPQEPYSPPISPLPPTPSEVNVPQAPTGPASVNSPMVSDSTQIVCEIKRHPIGILGLYVANGLLVLVLAVLAFIVAPHVLTGFSSGQVMRIGAVIFVLVSLVASGILFVAHKVYWDNRWLVTSDNITQIRRTSLFSKETSQLSLANLEDITAAQDGFLPQVFHYGVISAETAAATDKFTFVYCPKPSYYTQQILAARERFEERRRQAGQANQPATPQASSLADSLANVSQNITEQ